MKLTVKALDKKADKGDQSNQQNDDNRNQNYVNRDPKPPIIYCQYCERNNYPLNLSMNCPNPKQGHKCTAKFSRIHGRSEVNYDKA